MTVYVDPLLNHGWILRGKPVKSCHLLADNLDELHNFAEKIGLKRSWLHDSKSGAHYDLTESKRDLAVKNGAKEISLKELAAMVRKTLDAMAERNKQEAEIED